jgi:hypothetical protein
MALDDSTIQQDVPSDHGNPDTLPPEDGSSSSAASKNNPPPASGPAQPPLKSERELAMEALEARHHAQIARENGMDLSEVTGNPDDQLAAQTAQLPADPDHDGTPAEPSTAPAPSAGRQTVKVKVDGVESEVPLDDVVRNYQKNSSADRKLAEAARLQREAAELQAQLVARNQQLQAQLAHQPTNTPAAPAAASDSPEPSADVQEKGKAFLKALFEGDEETALQQLAELTKGRNAPQPVPAIPDVSQLAEQVAAHVQQKLHVDSALAQHRKDYPEIYADPDMEGFVLAKVNGVRRESGEEFFTALNRVSNEFAQKFGWSASSSGRPSSAAAAPTTNNTRAVKLERKASIDNVSSVNTKTGSTEAVPETTSDVIAQMRAERLKG